MQYGSSSLGNPFGMSPFQVGGLPRMSSMNQAGGFRTVSPGEFYAAQLSKIPGGSQFGSSRRTMGRMPTLAGGPDPDMVGGVPFGEDRQPGRLERLLTGGRGAAIGGIAQAGASVLGSYLDRKVEREKLQEQRRIRARQEKQEDEMRALLDPLFREQMERARRYQQQMDEQRARG
jgi:hypothetical protein